jgi:polar amino acid transport system permease protein
MSYSFQFRDVFAAWEFLLNGLVLTLELSVVTMVCGLAIGLAGAAARVYGSPALRGAVAVYVEAIRNTPFLVQLLLIYLGLPSIGIRLTRTRRIFCSRASLWKGSLSRFAARLPVPAAAMSSATTTKV